MQLIPSQVDQEYSIHKRVENQEKMEWKGPARPKLGVSFCSGVFCNRTFDMYICWPDGFPGTTVNVSCPWYLPWQSRVRDRYAFRYCSDNGSWLLDLVSQGPWADSSQCAEDDAFLHQQVVRHSIQRKLRFVYTAGYTLSLISLVAANLTLISLRKLRCTRNYIHVNLFSSFILRAISVLLKDSFTDSPDSESVPTEGTHSTGSDTVRKSMLFIASGPILWTQGEELQLAPLIWGECKTVCYMESCEALWRGRLCICSCILLLQVPCRAAQLLLHYSVASSWYWLLVEGIFLYTLLVLSVFSPTKSYRLYLMIGWGLPLAPLIPWTLVKYFQENSGCWRQNSNMGFWWILRAPLLLVICINVAIFVRIMMLLISKMRSHQMQNTDFRYRLTKSTLILIPMLGVHEIVLALVTDEMAEGTLRYLKLSVELFFGSVQGFLVAVLYCFINREVQNEVCKELFQWKVAKCLSWKRNSPVTNSNCCQQKGTRSHDEPGAREELDSPCTDEAFLSMASSSCELELCHQTPNTLLQVSAV
eukprot:gi/632952725/ref/XP_007892007.1/ PREDICTED: glucagon-like peptide 1 receptor [Callorhinchus milii]